MNQEKIKKRNIKFLFGGVFFMTLSHVFVEFFLPFFLKEQGLSILKIGFLITIGLAVGSLITTIGFSHVLKKIKLRTGLMLSSFFNFLHSGFLFIFPHATGAFFAETSGNIRKSLFLVADDVALQHNISKNHSKISSQSLMFDVCGFIVGLLLSLLLIPLIGFRVSFMIFSLLTIPAFFFYFNIQDETRFKPKKKTSLPKVSSKLKLVLFSEIIYWLGLGASFSLVITFLVTDLFSESYVWIGILFLALYVSLNLTTFLMRKFFASANLLRLSIFGMALLLLSAIIMILSGNVYGALASMLLEGVGAGIWVPSKKAVYWKLTAPTLREQVSGYLHGMRNFVSIIGPLVGGWLVVTFNIFAPFYFKAGIALLSIIIYIAVLKKS